MGGLGYTNSSTTRMRMNTVSKRVIRAKPLDPMASLGKQLGIRVRGMESIIRLASIIRKKDYWEIGRTVESLGLAHLAPEELLSMAVDNTTSQYKIEATTPYYVPVG